MPICMLLGFYVNISLIRKFKSPIINNISMRAAKKSDHVLTTKLFQLQRSESDVLTMIFIKILLLSALIRQTGAQILRKVYFFQIIKCVLFRQQKHQE